MSSRAISKLDSEIRALHDMLKDAPFSVFLVGGLGLAVRSERFYRNHRDIDLAVDRSDLPALGNLLADSGYLLGAQRFSTYLGLRHRLQSVRPVAELPAADPDVTKFRAFRASGRRLRYAPSRLDYLDIFLLSRREDGVVLHGFDTVVPWDAWHPTTMLGDGSALRLPNSAYRLHLGPRGRKQRADFERAGLLGVPSPLV